MNKQQQELLALILWDMELVNTNELDKSNRAHLKLAKGNLKDLLKQLNIKEHGE
jgi:hypothetical protein